jgi:hypothetical protein
MALDIQIDGDEVCVSARGSVLPSEGVRPARELR